MAPTAMEIDGDSAQMRNSPTALIAAVRSLDDKDGLSLPDRIQRIWALLSSAKNIRLHSVEETILRWLLKQMTPSTDDAEHVRRHPLSWAILRLTFSKIPPQVLGRVLADRKFTAVLNKTLDDLCQTTPVKVPAADALDTTLNKKSKSNKRKRADTTPCDIESLRRPEGSIKSAAEIFNALAALLLSDIRPAKTATPEHFVGVEHIKSLFSSAADDTSAITSKLLRLCHHSLEVVRDAVAPAQEQWINILAHVWSLRPHSSSDSYHFASHFYDPVCHIHALLKGCSETTSLAEHQAMRDRWLRDLEHFLASQFIRPARHQFAINGDVPVLHHALQTTIAKIPHATCYLLWDMATRVPRNQDDPKSKAEHDEWAERVFREMVDSLQDFGEQNPIERNTILVELMRTASRTASIPSTATLQQVCKACAFSTDHKDWRMLAVAISCDADILLMGDHVADKVFEAVTANVTYGSDSLDTVVCEVIVPMLRAFAKSRDLSGFAKRWYECMCDSISLFDPESELSALCHPEISKHFGNILQDSLTSAQLGRLLDWLQSQPFQSGPLLVLLDGISQGVVDEDYVAEADDRIFDMAFEGKSYKSERSPWVRQLRWQIARRMASWETAEKVDRLWTNVQKELKKTLKGGDLQAGDVREALYCCHSLWLANHPSGKHRSELAQLTCFSFNSLISSLNKDDQILPLQRYLDFIIAELPRLAESAKSQSTEVQSMLVGLSQRLANLTNTSNGDAARQTHQALLDHTDVANNEQLVDALVSPVLDRLLGKDAPNGKSEWTGADCLNILNDLLGFPAEAFTRGRRKRIMLSWKRNRSEATKRASKDAAYAFAMLRLLVKVMQQPTFYEDMNFDDLVYLTSHLKQTDDAQVLLVQRFIQLTLEHVAGSSEDSSLQYLNQAAQHIENLKSSKSGSPQFMLAQGLLSAIKNTPSAKAREAIEVPKVSRRLRKILEHTFTAIGSGRDADKADTRRDLRVALSAAETIADALHEKPLDFSDETISDLDSLSKAYVSRGLDLGWKLQALLATNCPQKYSVETVRSLLECEVPGHMELPIAAFVEAFVTRVTASTTAKLVEELTAGADLLQGSLGSLLALKRVVELRETNNPEGGDEKTTIDLAALHQKLVSILPRATTVRHFKYLSDIVNILLEKHSGSMTQFNIESTLTSVMEVCSPDGPRLPEPKAPGQVFEAIYKLVATVIKRHRHRLEGHFPILISTLQSLLRVLLTNPSAVASAKSAQTSTQALQPPWLTSRLQGRHAARFSRLVTLICEPSAAAVARHGPSANRLDSATDAAKRAAGRDMFALLQMFIRLQLEGADAAVDMDGDVRRALEPGLWAILDVTPHGSRRVLNESIDNNGRAVFRQLYAGYKKFGKWSGI